MSVQLLTYDGVTDQTGVQILFQTTNTGDRYKSAMEERRWTTKVVFAGAVVVVVVVVVVRVLVVVVAMEQQKQC